MVHGRYIVHEDACRPYSIIKCERDIGVVPNFAAEGVRLVSYVVCIGNGDPGVPLRCGGTGACDRTLRMHCPGAHPCLFV